MKFPIDQKEIEEMYDKDINEITKFEKALYIANKKGMLLNHNKIFEKYFNEDTIVITEEKKIPPMIVKVKAEDYDTYDKFYNKCSKVLENILSYAGDSIRELLPFMDDCNLLMTVTMKDKSFTNIARKIAEDTGKNINVEIKNVYEYPRDYNDMPDEPWPINIVIRDHNMGICRNFKYTFINENKNENLPNKITQSEIIAPVTVKELIDILNNYNPNARVFFERNSNACFWIASLDTVPSVIISNKCQEYVTPSQIDKVTDILNNAIEGDYFVAMEMAAAMVKIECRKIDIQINTTKTIISYKYTITKRKQFGDFCYQFRDPMLPSFIRSIEISINGSIPVVFVYDAETNKFCYTGNKIYSPEWQTASKDENE